MTLRAGDLLLYQTDDGGEISVSNGEPVMDGGFQSSAYLSIAVIEEESNWMNEYLTEIQQLNSQYLSFIKGNSKTAENILKAEKLAYLDFKWMLDLKAVDEIIVAITSTGVERVKLTLQILANGDTIETNEFEINWAFEATDPANLRI